MRPITIVALVLIAGGGVAMWLIGGSVASAAGLLVPEVRAGKAGTRSVKMQLQIVELQKEFKPTLFEAIDIVPEGQKPSLNAPRILVRYDGDDKLNLENFSHVSVEGVWDAGKEMLVATRLSTQCPSHYAESGKPLPPTPIGLASDKPVSPNDPAWEKTTVREDGCIQLGWADMTQENFAELANYVEGTFDQNGRANGLRFSDDLPENKLARAAGARPGDIIKSVNGQSVVSLGEVKRVVTKLRNAGETTFNVVYERNGREQIKTFHAQPKK